jgi:two-component system sensor histidine kinase HupT/HoxJ
MPILERHVDEDETGRLEKALPRLERKMELILDGAERISHLVRKFKTHYKEAEQSKKECRLLHIVNDATELLVHRFKRGYKLAVNVADELTIYGDPQKLSQVFVNLFNCAMDAMGAEKGAISIAAARSNGHVNIHVKDDGPGLDREQVHRVLGPDFTLVEKEEKTGVDLFVARTIIEDHNGRIGLGEPCGVGAQFDIMLPASSD